MVKLVALICLMVGCAPFTRFVAKKCPPTTASLLDVLAGIGMLTVGQIKLDNAKFAEGGAWSFAGGVVLGAAYSSELTCSRRIK